MCQKNYKTGKHYWEDLDIHAEQTPREDADAGLIRLFIVQQHEGINKDEVEQTVMKIMSDHTADEKWFGKDADVKILTLEHMMAARRLGFDQFFGPLSRVTKYQMTFLQGTVYELEFFTKEISAYSRFHKRRWTGRS